VLWRLRAHEIRVLKIQEPGRSRRGRRVASGRPGTKEASEVAASVVAHGCRSEIPKLGREQRVCRAQRVREGLDEPMQHREPACWKQLCAQEPLRLALSAPIAVIDGARSQSDELLDSVGIPGRLLAALRAEPRYSRDKKGSIVLHEIRLEAIEREWRLFACSLRRDQRDRRCEARRNLGASNRREQHCNHSKQWCLRWLGFLAAAGWSTRRQRERVQARLSRNRCLDQPHHFCIAEVQRDWPCARGKHAEKQVCSAGTPVREISMPPNRQECDGTRHSRAGSP